MGCSGVRFQPRNTAPGGGVGTGLLRSQRSAPPNDAGLAGEASRRRGPGRDIGGPESYELAFLVPYITIIGLQKRLELRDGGALRHSFRRVVGVAIALREPQGEGKLSVARTRAQWTLSPICEKREPPSAPAKRRPPLNKILCHKLSERN